MKRKTIILAVVAAAAMALTLVGCGVKTTNIAVPESAMVEKGESITLPVVYGTDDAPAVTPETAAPAPAQPDPQPSNPEPSQPSGGDSGSTENKPNGSDGWEWGGPVISTPTDNGCPPEEHAVGWC